MTPLASIADLTARGVVVSAEEEDAVNAFLATASALLRDAAGSPISETTSTVTLYGEGRRLTLPGTPCTAVSEVYEDGEPVTDYVLVNGSLWRSCGFHGPVTVTYTHGLPEVPADIVDMVCRLAGQALSAFRSGDATTRAVRSERIGDYSVSYADTETGTMTLSDAQRARLAARFGTSVRTAVTR
ncbi:hypothetical protein [Streptomyces albidoflavus]|uniref:hypothetical protein n=1 Tax=Streptomyces albidoflavus TaxID=1886 RepID=UPI002E158B38|nr:hypothetical protein OG695_16515 [Streptomyces albidoflavus]